MQPPRKLGRKKEEQHRGPLAPSYPIAAITSMASERQDKRWANRNHRSATHRAVKRDTDPDATVLPILREVSGKWAMAKDGRS